MISGEPEKERKSQAVAIAIENMLLFFVDHAGSAY